MFVCLLLASSQANKWLPYTPAIITFTQQGCHSGTHAMLWARCVAWTRKQQRILEEKKNLNGQRFDDQPHKIYFMSSLYVWILCCNTIQCVHEWLDLTDTIQHDVQCQSGAHELKSLFLCESRGGFYQCRYLSGFHGGGPLFFIVASLIWPGQCNRKQGHHRNKVRPITNVWLMWLSPGENKPLLHFQQLQLTQYDVPEMVVMAV